MTKEEASKKPEIDLSKISNLSATNDTALQKKANLEKSKRKSNKFNFNLTTERVQLPSGGYLYDTEDEIIKNGFIDLYPMTVKEEEILSTQRFLKKGIATRMILDNCIASDISAKDLLLFDSNYLIYALRQISYGDEYKFKIKCTSATCGKEFSHSLFISSLTFNELPENIVEPIEIILPKTKYVVRAILPRVVHSEQIQMLKEKEKQKTTSDVENNLVLQMLVTTIDITSPDGEEVNQKDWKEFFESIPSFDRAAISDSVRYEVEIDKLKEVECPYCGTEYILV